MTSQDGSAPFAHDVTYDSLGRISTYTMSGGTASYQIDEFGNIEVRSIPGQPVANYSFTNNRIDGLAYNSAGALLQHGGKTLRTTMP